MCSTEILLPIPPHLWAQNAVPQEGSEHVVNEAGEHCIPVDACIVPAVRALWDAGIVTLASCCGHVAPGDEHPYGVITIQTRPGVAQRGATLLRRERYDELTAIASAARAYREVAFDKLAPYGEAVRRAEALFAVVDRAAEAMGATE